MTTPRASFLSDNTATICPELLAAITAANEGRAQAYGHDQWTQRLNEAFSAFFDTDVHVFPLLTGTAANSLALSTLTPPYGAIFAHEQAHVVRDECGAPEFFSGGAKLVTLRGPQGKITPEALAQALNANPPSVHSVQPATLHLTQPTEYGVTYRSQEIAALAGFARSHGLRVHMDGARLANALAFIGCHPAEMTWRAGVDVLSFGATKNGGLAAECVVFFSPDLVRDFELRRKRGGHLVSKSRYISVQLLAYLEPNVWRPNAERANAFARQIGHSAHQFLVHPVEANEVFLKLDKMDAQQLRDDGFEFEDWGARESGECRFVASWDQSIQEVQALCSSLEVLQVR